MSDRTLRTLTWLLVGAIALIAFAVSFEAISAYAVAVGAFPRPLRWCAPLLVDAFTVAACLVILARSRDGERAVYAWSLVVVASTVSVALNVAHAPPPHLGPAGRLPPAGGATCRPRAGHERGPAAAGPRRSRGGRCAACTRPRAVRTRACPGRGRR